jgi:ABC-type glycerol-3-phosphate transport system substrate-binding protein
MRTILSLALIISALSGPSQAIASGSGAKPVEFWVNGQTDEKYFLDMIKVYQEKVDKDFKANVRSYGFTEMPDKLAIAIKSGVNPPDIVQLDEIYFSLYLRSQIPFLDLTDRIRKARLDETILRQRMGLFTWQGKTYGVPQSVSNVVMYYRDDVFRDLGITPKSIDTWDKFEAVAKKIKTGNRFMLALDWSYFEILMRQRGYEIFAPDGRPLPDSARALEVLERLQGWLKDGVAQVPDRGSIFEPEFFNAYVANNSVLTVLGADWYGLDMLKSFDPKHAGKWKAMPMPMWTDPKSRGRNRTSSFSGQGLVIFKKSRQADRAWKFIEWVMTDIDANVERYKQGNCFTPYKPAWTDLRFNEPDPYFANQALAGLLMELAPRVPNVIQSPQRAEFVNLFREKYWNSLALSGTPAKDVLRDLRIELAGGKPGEPPAPGSSSAPAPAQPAATAPGGKNP